MKKQNKRREREEKKGNRRRRTEKREGKRREEKGREWREGEVREGTEKGRKERRKRRREEKEEKKKRKGRKRGKEEKGREAFRPIDVLLTLMKIASRISPRFELRNLRWKRAMLNLSDHISSSSLCFLFFFPRFISIIFPFLLLLFLPRLPHRRIEEHPVRCRFQILKIIHNSSHCKRRTQIDKLRSYREEKEEEKVSSQKRSTKRRSLE